MKLSALKSECFFFTTNTHEATWRPALYLCRQQIKYHPNPKFLVIAYNRHLSFGLHASIVGSKMKQQYGASTDWGYDKSIIRSTYIATGRSTVVYAAAAWLPCASFSTKEKLEMCQRYIRREITGQIKTIPVEAILAEADLPTVANGATQLSTIVIE